MLTDIDRDMDDFKPDLIVGISRGGLIPAVMLSHIMEAPMIPLVWQTRDGQECDRNNQQLHDAINEGKNVLIVDDINDSGRTFCEISEAYQTEYQLHVRYVALIDRAKSEFGTDYRGLTVTHDGWFAFPWE